VATASTRFRLHEGPVPWTALAAAVLFCRFPDWFLRPRLWAEDGNVFMLGARTQGLGAVFSAYAGYLHLIPRFVAEAGAWLDPALVPALYVCAALLAALAVVARTFSPRLRLPCRPLLALAIVAVPHTGEVFLCPTNIQWVTSLALVQALLMRDPAGAGEWASDLSVVALAGLTGPFSVILLPLFLVRALERASLASWGVAAAVLLAAGAQAGQMLAHPLVPPPGFPTGPFNFPNLADVMACRLPLAFLGGQEWVFRAGRPVVLAAGGVCAAVFACFVLVRDDFRRERVYLVLAGALVCGATLSRVRCDLWDYRDMVSGDRYFYMPRVLMLWVVALGCPPMPRRAQWGAPAAAMAGLACLWLMPYREGPAFVVRHVERPFYAWQPYCAGLRAGEAVEVQVSPGWKFRVPNPSKPW